MSSGSCKYIDITSSIVLYMLRWAVTTRGSKMDSKEAEKIRKFIRETRTGLIIDGHPVSQDTIVMLLGMTSSHYSRIETGAFDVIPEYLITIMRMLSRHPEDLEVLLADAETRVVAKVIKKMRKGGKYLAPKKGGAK
jgi:hypothetical protein